MQGAEIIHLLKLLFHFIKKGYVANIRPPGKSVREARYINDCFALVSPTPLPPQNYRIITKKATFYHFSWAYFPLI